jgi:hypothetical protein
MIIYSVEDGGEDGDGYYPTLKLAREEAQATANFLGQPIQITRNFIGKIDRLQACRMVEGQGWRARSEVVATMFPRKESSHD